MHFAEIGIRLAETGRHLRFRFPVLVSGDHDWTVDAAAAILKSPAFQNPVVVSQGRHDRLPFAQQCIIKPEQARRYLGSTLSGAVFVCHDGFDPDALGILCGCIRAGGILIFCTPALPGWEDASEQLRGSANRNACMPNYVSRIARILAGSPSITRVTQDGYQELQLPSSSGATGHTTEPSFRDQQAAVAAVKKVIIGQRRRPTLLEADRGRGKSAALGIAAGELMQSGPLRIAVTGLNKASVGTLLVHAADHRTDPAYAVCFHAPDMLIRDKPDLDLLLVDEAATIPLPMLEQLLRHYPRIAFASTVHGYEGTGMGFVLKFHRILDRLTRGWRHVRLEEPIRWAAGDPLDRLACEMLILDAEPAATAPAAKACSGARLQALEPQMLVQDESLLREVFALLAQAHYRTRPSDLVQLLDGGNLRLFRLHYQTDTLGVCLVAEEGNLPQEMSAPVLANRRRPPYNLLPEVLCAQLGFAEAMTMRMIRVVRIAVREPARRNGLGSRILDHVKQHYSDQTDLIGTSCGLEEPLLAFWEKNRFILSRIGMGKSHNTGTHSAVLLQGTSARGQDLAERAAAKLGRHLPLQFAMFLNEMEADLAGACTRHLRRYLILQEPDHQDFEELAGFAAGNARLASVIAAVTKIAWLALVRNPGDMEPEDRRLLTERILMHKSWQSCTSLPMPKSDKEGIRHLQRIVRMLMTTVYKARAGESRKIQSVD